MTSEETILYSKLPIEEQCTHKVILLSNFLINFLFQLLAEVIVGFVNCN